MESQPSPSGWQHQAHSALPEYVTAACPWDGYEGQTLDVAYGGVVMQATVPPGVGPGQQFLVRLHVLD
eukprot:SAG31_NODE_490_length_14932_cov_9.350300_4_plen_68_part_00